MISYTEYKPAAILSGYIDCYWSATGGSHSGKISYNVLPDCCCDILINTGDTINPGTEAAIHSNMAFIVGTSTSYQQVSLAGNISVIGIRFKPLGLSVLLQNMPVGDFKNDAIDLGLVSKPKLDSILNYRNAAGIPLNEQLDNVMLGMFKHCIIQSPTVAIARHAMNIIEQENGIVRIDDLSRLVNTSRRNLERLFYKNVGLSPKEFAQITRLKSIKKELAVAGNKSLAQIAFEHNYYDSAHFTHDFINFAGAPPSHCL